MCQKRIIRVLFTTLLSSTFALTILVMKHISVIVPMGKTVVDTVIAPYNLLRMANAKMPKSRQFRIDLVGLNKQEVTYQGLFSIKPTATIDEVSKSDLIVISPISGNLSEEIENNKLFINWIKQQRIENGSELASLCKGAFLLAETGLVNGKTCATHWTAHDEFKLRYPEVNLMPENIICEEGGIYSSGGAYSILNFTLYLIERYFGREIAIWCSKIAEIDFDRRSQSEFIVFSGQKNHEDEAIRKAQNYIEQNYQEKLTVDELASIVHLNSRSFLRRFKKATYNKPLEYIQRVKIEAAKRQLENTSQTVLQVMYYVGYNDEKAFRATFRKFSGLAPKEYQMKYNREMAMS